ncbi:uncharacterized protein G2W53_009512 [Senna tora]|uniref:Uncharacterized protein n=1 Tax=Senna tora TaxID=362788 RepID=A0A834WY66_9FABA|nr:uncharacterized protein G2W53_009512 [Senna tora]
MVESLSAWNKENFVQVEKNIKDLKQDISKAHSSSTPDLDTLTSNHQRFEHHLHHNRSVSLKTSLRTQSVSSLLAFREKSRLIKFFSIPLLSHGGTSGDGRSLTPQRDDIA